MSLCLLSLPGLSHKQRLSNFDPSQIFKCRSHLAASSCCWCCWGWCRRPGCFWGGWRVRVCRISAFCLYLWLFSEAALPSSRLSALISRSMLPFPWLYSNSDVDESLSMTTWNLVEMMTHTHTHRLQAVWFTLKWNVTASFSPVHCWTWIHCPLQVLQHHQLHLHLGEVSTLIPSDPNHCF